MAVRVLRAAISIAALLLFAVLAVGTVSASMAVAVAVEEVEDSQSVDTDAFVTVDSEINSDSEYESESESEAEAEAGVETAEDEDSDSDSESDESGGAEFEGEGVEIKYCAACGYHDRFLQIKTEIERRAPGTTVKGYPSSQRMDGHEFDIAVNGKVISERAVVTTNDVMVEHILGVLRATDEDTPWDPWHTYQQYPNGATPIV